MIMPSHARPAIAAASALALALAAAAPAIAADAAGMPGQASDATVTVEVTMGDNFFEPRTIEIPAGTTVRFVVNNEGGLLHEFNIGTAASHAAMQDELQMMTDHGLLTGTGMDHGMMSMGHGSEAGMATSEMLESLNGYPNRVLVEPGQTADLVWTFAEPVILEFACNLPGHYESGMVGDLEVTP
jgi:uncharacterized cupredoxin-like copper-binding protein